MQKRVADMATSVLDFPHNPDTDGVAAFCPGILEVHENPQRSVFAANGTAAGPDISACSRDDGDGAKTTI